MRRRRFIVAAVLVAAPVAVLLNVPAAVAGGGGCHQAATDAQGDRVVVGNFCFTPTILRMPKGGKVTFLNKDDVEHPTSAPGDSWFIDGSPSKEYTVSFDKPGIYPYFCQAHIGMVGVVVVGDGVGTGAATVQAAPPPAAQPETAAAQPGAAVVAGEPAAAQRSSAWSLPGAVVLALALGLAAAAVVVVRRRQTPSGPVSRA